MGGKKEQAPSNEKRGKTFLLDCKRSLARPSTLDLNLNPFSPSLFLPLSLLLSLPLSSSAPPSIHQTQQDLSKYEAVIGIECHVQLSTQSKAFCSCSNEAGRKDSPSPPSSTDEDGNDDSATSPRPNSSVCPICLGHPGTLPALNAAAVAKGVAAGLALNCRLAPRLKFDRKQYFYPDLPKGYQISQHDEPLCSAGSLEVPLPPGESSSSSVEEGAQGGKKGGGKKSKGGDATPAATLDTFTVSIERAHLEEDAGKLLHAGSAQLSGASSHSLVDYNRAGVPLLEVVSGPDLRSGAQAAAYGAELRRLMVYLGVSRAAMQDGGMRCDVNVSVRRRGVGAGLGTKVEVKNMNSFSAMARAVDWEVARQAALLDEGRAAEIVQETRLFDEATGETAPMRSKGGAADYRYVAEPDLPPGRLPEGLVEEVRAALPELPAAFRRRLSQELGLPAADVLVLSDEASTARFFSAALESLPCSPPAAPSAALVKLLSNWVVGDVMAHCKEAKRPMDELEHLTPRALAEMVALIGDGTLSGKGGKTLLPLLLAGEANDKSGEGPGSSSSSSSSSSFSAGGVRALVEARGMAQISDQASIDALVDGVLAANAAQLAEFRAGKTKLQGFFVGELMKASEGRANPALLNATLARKLKGD